LLTAGRHVEADRLGDLLSLDTFHVGELMAPVGSSAS
jgi:hypothetical protein